MAIRLIVQGPSAESPGRAYSLLFDQPRIHLGRSASADLCLPHASVSALHASIRLEGTSYVIVDEDSTNGTRVDTQLLPPQRKKKLSDGALIHVGVFAVRVELINALPEPADPRRCAFVARALLVDLLETEGETIDPPALIPGGAEELSSEPLWLIDYPLPLALGVDTAGALSVAQPLNEEDALGIIHEEGTVYSVEALSDALLMDGQPFRKRRLRSGAILSHGSERLAFSDPIEEALEARYLLPDEEGEFELPASDGIEERPSEITREEAPIEASEGSTPETDRAPELSSETRPSGASPRWEPRSSKASLTPRRAEGSDAIVYMLAGAMIALSVLGLYLLLGRL